MILIAAIGSVGERELRTLLAECEGLSDERITVFRKDIGTPNAAALPKAVAFGGSAPAWNSHGTSVPGMSRSFRRNANIRYNAGWQPISRSAKRTDGVHTAG